MSRWLVARDRLTKEQLDAVQLPPSGRHVVLGMPGSGKTLVLVHRAKYLLETQHVQPARLHLFVYNRMLRYYIQSALDDLGIPQSCAETVDAWCASVYRRLVSPRLPRSEGDVDYEAIRVAVRERVSRPLFDQLLVDEGQDMSASQWDILLALSRNMTVCMDFMQQLYEEGTDETVVLQKLGIDIRRRNLITLLRCCPYIIDLASRFIPDQSQAQAFLRQCRTTQTEKETPLIYVRDKGEDESDRLAEAIRARQMKGDSIGILFSKRKHVAGFTKELTLRGLRLETMPFSYNDGVGLNFSSDLPKVMTYHSAKGLTFDSVFLPNLVPDSFRRWSQHAINRMLFVGITRALKWVYLGTTEDGVLPMQDLQPLIREGKLTVQHSQGAAGNLRQVPEGPERKPAKKDPLDIL